MPNEVTNCKNDGCKNPVSSMNNIPGLPREFCSPACHVEASARTWREYAQQALPQLNKWVKQLRQAGDLIPSQVWPSVRALIQDEIQDDLFSHALLADCYRLPEIDKEVAFWESQLYSEQWNKKHMPLHWNRKEEQRFKEKVTLLKGQRRSLIRMPFVILDYHYRAARERGLV